MKTFLLIFIQKIILLLASLLSNVCLTLPTCYSFAQEKYNSEEFPVGVMFVCTVVTHTISTTLLDISSIGN